MWEEYDKLVDVLNLSSRILEIQKQLNETQDFNEQIPLMIKLAEIESNITLMEELKETIEEYEFWLTEFPEEPAAEKKKQEIERLINFIHESIYFNGEYDDYNCIVTIHAGAGGTEAQDWAEMLYNMYEGFCRQEALRFAVIDTLKGDVAGIKSVTFEVKGRHAYGLMKNERGVHRLVRISPFDANKRRHTSFAAVDVMPMVETDNEVELDMRDVQVDTYRSGGAGGQHVNKTDSAVRLTHVPTGIVVQCQDERSQTENKNRAIKLLKSKLLNKQIEEQEEEIRKLRGEVSDNGWGSQIRSYVFQPYQMVKDHRTGYEVGNIEDVMKGNIKPFIMANLERLCDNEHRNS